MQLRAKGDGILLLHAKFIIIILFEKICDPTQHH